jgi:DNA-binding transcriptional regulator YhcF (GntR family)
VSQREKKPSSLSKAFKINPNTAHKVVTHLTEGLLEVRPGIGTVVAAPASATAAERRNLLKNELEELVVEAKNVGLSLEDVTAALAQHWTLLDGSRSGRKE